MAPSSPSQAHGSRLMACGLLIIVIIAAAPLWIGPGIIHTRAGGDSPFLLQRTFELAENLRAGAIPARWMPNANFGLGYPFFNFYAALPYYLAAGLNVLGLDLLVSIQLTQTLGMFAAAGSMWLLAQRLLSKLGAALAAIAYTLAPFHLANLYVRGDSLSEFWAFAYFPLILWGGLRGGKRGWWALALGLAGLAITHNVSTLLFAPFLLLFCGWQMWQAPRKLERGLALVGAGLSAIALSAWFWLPALVGTSAVQLDEQTTGYLNYANHFRGLNLVQPRVLFDYSIDAELGVFSMGLVQAVFTLAGMLIWLRQRRPARWLIPVLFVLASLLITPLSAPIWQWLKPLQLAQFPWRVLSVQSLFSALLIGAIATDLPINDLKRFGRFRPLLIVLLVAGTLTAAMMTGVPNQRLWVAADDVSPANLRLFEWFSGNIGTTIRAEYLPKTALPKPVTGPGMLNQPAHAIALSGEIVTSARLMAAPTAQIWQIAVSSQQAEVVLPLLYWPAWRAKIGGQEIALTANPGSGWAKLILPQGEHTLSLWLDKTPDQRWAEYVSLVVLIALAGLGLRQSAQIFKVSSVFISREGYLSMGLIVAVTLAIIFSVSALPSTQSPLANLQTLDFDGRPYPHRAPIQFHEAQPSIPNPQPFTLLAAQISPANVRAGDAFMLSLTWQDDRAPAQVQIIQELPSGLANEAIASRIFRYARSVSPANGSSSQHTALPEAPVGPLLLKLAVSDASAHPMSATLVTGETLNAFWLIGLNISETLPVAPSASRVPALRDFGNGIRLNEIDWQQQDGDHVCIRPTWSSSQPIADALQVSIRLRNASDEDVATVDGQPHMGLSPTWSWPVNTVIKDSYCNTPIRKHLQAGEAYRIQMIWYRVADQVPVGEASVGGTRLPEMNGWHNPK